MEVICNNYMPGDTRLVEQLVSELKSQGIFDQFRKECISDVDTKPAYQNLRQRVEGTVTTFLNQQAWSIDLNKNQLREQLRKNLHESGFLETGVERIVDQVVNPKISTVFLPKVEDVVYRFLGIERPAGRIIIKQDEKKVSITDLLPTDLEAVSPESVNSFKTEKKNDSAHDSLHSSGKMDEDESPPFEPLGVQNSHENSMSQDDTKMQIDENSRDSHLSGFSGLESHESNLGSDTKTYQMDLSNQDSLNSIEMRLSIITSEETTKMEISEDSITEIKNYKPEISSNEAVAANDVENVISVVTDVRKEESINDILNDKIEEPEKKDRKHEKQDEKKSRSSEKSKERRDDKYKKSGSSKEKEKSSSKHSSYKDSKDKDVNKKDSKSGSSSSHRDKDRNKERSSDSKDKDKDKSSKYKDKNEKSKHEKDRTAEKSKSDKDVNKDEKNKDRDKDKNKPDKNKYEKDKSSREKDKDKYKSDKDKYSKDKEKSKHKDTNDKERSSKSREKSDRDKDKNSKEKSSKDKDKDNIVKERVKDNDKDKIKTSNSTNSSSSKHSSSKDKKKEKYKNDADDSKSKSSSSDKPKKDDAKHSSSKKDSRDSKKKSKDDHYSSKIKKTDRRSTDRDSNDGTSSKNNCLNNYTESMSSRSENNSQEQSNSSFTGGSGESGNSDQAVLVTQNVTEISVQAEQTVVPMQIQPVKYMKPKFASNFEEARKIMKIRKQLARMERQNQLSLTRIDVPSIENGIVVKEAENVILKDRLLNNIEIDNVRRMDLLSNESVKSNNITDNLVISKVSITSSNEDINNLERDAHKINAIESSDLSMENFEALEAKLAQVMSKINYNSYESDDDYEFRGYSSTDILDFDKAEMQLISRKLEKEKYKSTLPVMGEYQDQTNRDDVYIVLDNHRLNNVRELSVVLNQSADNIFKNECVYLEKPTVYEENNLKFLLKIISNLQTEINDVVETSRNNFCPSNRGKKRKLDECVDFRNNNNIGYVTTVNKRRGSTSSNTITSKAIKKRMCNNTDIPDEHFSLPLSPAESDKSNDRKEEDLLIPMKQKRIIRGYSQRYSSEDLYKPRPIISRRNKFNKNTN